MSFIASYMNLKYMKQYLTYSKVYDQAKKNLALTLEYENGMTKAVENVKEDKSVVKLKFLPGYLGKWLEIHNLNPEGGALNSRNSDDHSFENRI